MGKKRGRGKREGEDTEGEEGKRYPSNVIVYLSTSEGYNFLFLLEGTRAYGEVGDRIKRRGISVGLNTFLNHRGRTIVS